MTIQRMKIVPHLFVGLGGCGSQVVNEIARKLKSRTEEYERYRNLVHFFAFDTDMGELKRCESVDHWIPVSQFDKRQFVEHAYGQRGAPEDTLFTAWWPEYYQPRATSGAGAGQIRIESRLSVYRTLKTMPQYLTAIRNAVRRCYDTSERWRDPDRQPMLHIAASLAGGTGSGAFLPVAYLFRDILAAHQAPIVVGTFVLPTVFQGMGLPSQQLDKIMANGYAALMELEYLQSAADTPHERIVFQYDPNAQGPCVVTHGPFNQVYLVDDVGKRAAVMGDPRQIYPHLADAAYTQIFSNIIERDRSTADNDEREISVADEQQYTKRYGSFGVSVLVLPDRDILEYVAHRFAAQALTQAFALSEDEAGLDQRARSLAAVSPEQREQQFVRELSSRARLPGGTGTFYRTALEWVDGSNAAGPGALAEFVRRLEGQLARLDAVHANLPHITEDWLLEFDEQPDEVRVQLARRLEAWNAAVEQAREATLAEARVLAAELAGSQHDHSLNKLIEGIGTTRVRYLLIRLDAALRQRGAGADKTLREARSRLEGWPERFRRFAQTLEEAAPKTFMERFTGNDYLEEVPTFVQWFQSSVFAPQRRALRADAELELYETLCATLNERRARLAALFAQLTEVRSSLLERSGELLRQGVARDVGGQSNEHVLDVEVYQDHLDPRHERLWQVIYRHHVRPELFDPEEIARTIQQAEAGVTGPRHVREAVIQALIELGRTKFRLSIVGGEEPGSLDDMGLHLRRGLEEEARIAWAWHRLKTRYPQIEEVPEEEWRASVEDVSQRRIDEYVSDKLSLAAHKSAPFWRLTEGPVRIEPKRYVALHPTYAADEWLQRHLTSLNHFHIPDSHLLRTDDAKRIVFYWNEMGVPLYRVASVSELGRRYEFVKTDELRRGPRYHAAELRYRSSYGPWREREAACEDRPCPDIPLHIERDWEGAPDPSLGLFPLTIEAVQTGQAKKEWKKNREDRRAHCLETARDADRADIRAFALCRTLGLIAQGPEGYGWTLSELERPADRLLGRFLDEAREAFARARPALKDFALRRVEQQLQELAHTRNRQAIEEVFRPRLGELECALLNLGARESKVVQEEMAVLAEEMNRLLAQV